MCKAVLLWMLQLSRGLKRNAFYWATVRNLKTRGFFYATKSNLRCQHWSLQNIIRFFGGITYVIGQCMTFEASVIARVFMREYNFPQLCSKREACGHEAWECSYTEYTQKNGAVSKVNKKFISHLTRAQRSPSAAATVQVSHERLVTA